MSRPIELCDYNTSSWEETHICNQRVGKVTRRGENKISMLDGKLEDSIAACRFKVSSRKSKFQDNRDRRE